MAVVGCAGGLLILGLIALLADHLQERKKRRCPNCGNQSREIKREEGEARLEQDRPNQNAPLPMRRLVTVTCKCKKCGKIWDRSFKEDVSYGEYDQHGPYGYHTGHTWQ